MPPLLPLLRQSNPPYNPILPVWSLVVGGEDVSAALSAGATFVEAASSTAGQASFTIGGFHALAVVNAPVTLSRGGIVIWEGFVKTVSVETDLATNQIATLITASSASAALAIQNPLSFLSSTDVAVIATAMLPATTPWGGPAVLGTSVGAFAFSDVSAALSTLSLAAGKTWRVQGGQVVFVDASNGITAINAAISGTPAVAAAVMLTGGTDVGARQALSSKYTSSSVSTGPTYMAAAPEASDQPTLDQIGAALLTRYGPGNIYGSVVAPFGAVNRAGDWIQDSNQVIAPITQTTYQLVSGDWKPTYVVGFAPLTTTPLVVPSLISQAINAPLTRTSGDFLQSGGGISVVGTAATMTAATVVLGNVSYSVPGVVLTLPTGPTTVQINATSTAFVIASQIATPAPTSAVPMYLVSMVGGQPTGTITLFSVGGVASNNLLPNSVNSSHLGPSAVMGSHIQPAQIQGLHLKPTRYSTNLVNVAGGSTSATSWWDATNSKYVDIGTITGTWATPTTSTTGPGGSLVHGYIIFAQTPNGYAIASPGVSAGSPGTPAQPTATSGGVIPAFVQVTYLTARGESLPSTELGGGGGGGGVFGLSGTVPSQVTGWNLYTTNGVSGTEKKENATPIAVGSTYTSVGNGTGVAPPVADTSGVLFTATSYATINWASVTGATKYIVGICTVDGSLGNSPWATTSTTATVAGSGVVFTPSSMTNILPNQIILIDTGGLQEASGVNSVTATTFTANSTLAHAAGASIRTIDTLKDVGTALTYRDDGSAGTAGTLPIYSIHGANIVWDTGAAIDAGTAAPYAGTLFVNANETVTPIFKHSRFNVTAFGTNRVYFTPIVTGASTQLLSTNTIAGSSTASKQTVTTNPGTGGTGGGGGGGGAGGGGKVIF